ncbi:MAG: Ca2+-binding EF-hand superfamily protein [Marinoscillum sp.]|jgi:Ca2+-binding EF-hand superfamily protein
MPQKDIRSKKLLFFFDILDTNKNGVIQSDDFIMVADKIGEALQSQREALITMRFKATRFYVQLVQDMGKQGVNIDRSEWLNFFLRIEETGYANKYVMHTSAYIFMLFDQNNDKMISRKEYANMFQIYNIDQHYIDQAFDKLDTNKDGTISLRELINAFREFLLSEDSDSPGNWIFGDWRSEV